MLKLKNIINMFFKKCFGTKSSRTVSITTVSGILIICIVISLVINIIKPLSVNNNITVPSAGSSDAPGNNSSTVLNTDKTNAENPSTEKTNPNPPVEAWKEVEKTYMPTDINGVTLTQAETENYFRGNTNWRIYSVRTTETSVKPSNGGTAYYISNSGTHSNDGLSPESPKKDLRDLQSLKLKSGDVVYFERGGIWRGGFTANVSGVTYSSYGEGKKPEIYSYTENAADEDDWEETETKNVYKYLTPIKQDIGNVIINGGERIGIKAVIKARNTDNSSNVTTGKPFFGYSDLDEDLHFFHDTYSDGTLYLYSESGNPGKIFDSIELGIKNNIISVTAADVTIDNLCLKYGGAHGVGAGSKATGLTVQNCEFGYIGGSILAENIFGRDYGTRYGNAVEIYGSAIDFTVKNNYIYQIYDTGITFQYNGSEHCIMENIDFSDNVIEYCNWSLEYYLTADDTSYIKNVLISNNLMWYSGYGLCEQRPDKNCDSHIKAWAHTNPISGSFNIKNNLFALAKTDLLQSSAKTGSGPYYSDNIYIQFSNGLLGDNGIVSDLRFNNAATFIPNYFYDKNAKIIYISN